MLIVKWIKANLRKLRNAKPRVLASFGEAMDDTSKDPKIAGLPKFVIEYSRSTGARVSVWLARTFTRRKLIMKTRINAIGFATVILAFASGLPSAAIADQMAEVKMRFAGSFGTNVLYVDPSTGDAVVSSLINVQAKGTLGSAEIRGFGGRSTVPPPDPVFNCLGSDGLFLSFEILENPLVFTFKDLSLLFAKGGSGVVCIDLLNPGASMFEIQIEFMGGRGRFEGATGVATLKGEGEAVSADGSFIGETGTIDGWVSAPFHKN